MISFNDKIRTFDFMSSALLAIPILMTSNSFFHGLYTIFNVLVDRELELENSIYLSIADTVITIISSLYMYLCFKRLSNELQKSVNLENINSKSMVKYKPIKFLSMNYLLSLNKIYIGKDNTLYIADKGISKRFLSNIYIIICAWIIMSLLDCVTGYCNEFIQPEIRIIITILFGIFCCYWINKKYLLLLYQKYNLQKPMS